MRAPTILVVNHWHDDNKGDGAISAATVELLAARYSGARIRVVGLLEGHADGDERAFRHLVSTHPTVTTEPAWLPSEHSTRKRWPFLGDRPASLLWLARTVPWAVSLATGIVPTRIRSRLAGVELVVAMGGSNIYDDPAVMEPASLGRLTSVLYVVWAAQRLGIPTVALGHTLGPFPRPIGRRLAARVLGRLRVIGVRDPRSRELAATMGISADLAPDVAYGLPTRSSPAVEAVAARFPTPMERSMLVLPRQHPSAGYEADGRFLAEVAATCRRLVAARVVEQIVVGAHCLGPTPIEDDRTSVSRLMPLLDGLPAVRLDADLAPQEQVALYGRALVTLSVRLHGSILAMVGGSPAFTVAYFSTKAEGAMADAGLPQAWTAFGDFRADDIMPIIEGLVDEATRDRLRPRIGELRHDLARRPSAWPELGRGPAALEQPA